jgi:transposase InsO family protein
MPPRSPDRNAYAERFVRSIKEECLDRMILFGEKMLRQAVQQFVAHYHAERNHQGLDNRIIAPDASVGRRDGPIECRERLGGLLKYYHRRAA